MIHNGDCLQVLPTLPDASIDAIITDPPYPEVKRPYGTLTVEQWHDMMDSVVSQAKRLLKPSGSAVFILQPNSEHVGQMRLWLWEFLVRTAASWNMIQDVYWWNHTSPPTVHCHRTKGLLRPSVKMCLWFGSPDCYRDQSSILWTPSEAMKTRNLEDRALKRQPSGQTFRNGRIKQTVEERGGVTPFNLLPLANTDSVQSSGAKGHGAGTPYRLCEWWVKYITRPGDTILDPFTGASTVGLAAQDHDRQFIGIERVSEYCDISRDRLFSVCTT